MTFQVLEVRHAGVECQLLASCVIAAQGHPAVDKGAALGSSGLSRASGGDLTSSCSGVSGPLLGVKPVFSLLTSSWPEGCRVLLTS